MPDTWTKPPVFVLGDSRTGTLSLHNFFTLVGLRSVHYYIKEAEQTEPIHLEQEANQQRFLAFIRATRYDAYSDYPTRSHYKALIAEFSDAYLILTKRRSSEKWLTSMRSFLGKFGIKFNEAGLLANYERVNESIRNDCAAAGVRFLELCIEDDNAANSTALSNFLELGAIQAIPHDNASCEITLDIISRWHRLHPSGGDDTLETIEAAVHPSKVLLSEYGWAFLVNDTNDFLKVQFGRLRWTEEEQSRATATLQTRRDTLAAQGAAYHKFIIPEKSVIYREYMPRAVETLEQAADLPAQRLATACPGFVHYLADYLRDAKSYGQLYFRGDSHTNWLGAWFVYQFILRKLSTQSRTMPIIPIAELSATLASYEGDLWAQATESAKKEFASRWSLTLPSHGFDMAIKYALLPDRLHARRVATSHAYASRFTKRETFVYERADGQGPRAVIFRDSTLDFAHELIAQHFSRAVFIWHEGLVFPDVIEQEKPDVVFHVMAERFVTRYPCFSAWAPSAQLVAATSAPAP